MSEKIIGDLEFSDAVDALLGNKDNGIMIVARINGETLTSLMDLPVVDNLVDDDNIGEMGFAVGTSCEVISLSIVEQFNKLVEAKK